MIRDIKNISYGDFSKTPTNYSRKGLICSCLSIICDVSSNILEKNIKVKYEIEPNINRISNKITKVRKNYKYNSHEYWGNFKCIIELPPIFDKLNDEDFIIRTGYFTRDNIQVPFVVGIEIKNLQKYQMIKTKNDRNKKLNKISNS